MKKIWVHKARSLREANDFDQKYYRNMSPTERLDTVEFLRKEADRFLPNNNGKHSKRLRRVITIIKLKKKTSE